MPTQEDRLDRLEQKVAFMELEHLYEQRKASESTPSEQAYNLQEVNHHLTILLGIASGQERDIKVVKDDVRSVKDRVERIDQHITSFEEKVDKRFASIDQRFVSIDQRFASVEGKLEQVLQMLTTLTRIDKRETRMVHTTRGVNHPRFSLVYPSVFRALLRRAAPM